MIIYHIFTNNFDEYCDDKKEAIKIFNQFKEECGCARLYEMNSDNEDDNGDCIRSFGEYPL